MTSVRGLVSKIQHELIQGNLSPARTVALTEQLTALMGNVADERRVADVEYSKVLVQCFKDEKTANRARLMAQMSPEWNRAQEAKDIGNLVLEMVRTLRASTRLHMEELRGNR